MEILGELETRNIKGLGVREGGRTGFGVVSMCIGGKQGIATMFAKNE